MLLLLCLSASLFAQTSKQEYVEALQALLWDKNGKKENIDEAAVNRLISRMRPLGYAPSGVFQMTWIIAVSSDTMDARLSNVTE